MPAILKNKAVVGIGITLLVLVIGVFSTLGYVNGVRNTGIEYENSLNAQYQSNQNELSTYILQFNETLGIADKQSAELNSILVEAVKGRYDGAMEPGDEGSMFSAISEAYPDLTANTAMYARVQDLVVSGRNAYKNDQDLLLDKIRVYETWTDTGLFKSVVVNSLGFPSDRLEARIGTDVVRGDDALDRMKTLVLTDAAVEAYGDGTQKPLIEPKD